MRHARNGHRAASAERPDTAPAHFGVELLIKSLADFLVEFLRIRRRRKRKKQKGTKNTCADDSPAEPLPFRTDSHPSPLREKRGYSARRIGSTHGAWPISGAGRNARRLAYRAAAYRVRTLSVFFHLEPIEGARF